MLWFYTREQQTLILETRYDNDTKQYLATVIGAADVPETVRFQSAEAFRTWLSALERTLKANRWDSDGAPHVLPDGWPDQTPSE